MAYVFKKYNHLTEVINTYVKCIDNLHTLHLKDKLEILLCSKEMNLSNDSLKTVLQEIVTLDVSKLNLVELLKDRLY
jgi:hypothetical protein